MTKRKSKRTVLKHLGDERMYPNSYNDQQISREQAVEMIENVTDRNLPQGYKYNTNYNGFDISEWTVHKLTDKPKKFTLLPKNASKEEIGSIVLAGCCDDNNNDNLDLITQAAMLMVTYFTQTRKECKGGKMTSECKGGKMTAWSENSSFGEQTQAAIDAPELQKHIIKGQIYTILKRCKNIFIEQFKNQDVGFEELLNDLSQVFYKKNDAPLCYIASKNLCNSEHLDTGDHSRSFAYWVTEDTYEGAYLLFPQWGLAIELGHGRYISWDGKVCAHCSSIPRLSNDNKERNIYSLFTALTRSLYNDTVKTRRCDKVLMKRHKIGWAKTKETLFMSLCVGMKVQIKVIPPRIYKRLQNESSNQEMRKLLKKYHYFQTNKIVTISGDSITLKKEFAKTIWTMSLQKTWINLVV